jgi:hypothetical protein
MEIAVDPDRLAEVVVWALTEQTAEARADLIGRMSTETVRVFAGRGGRDEYWTLVLGDDAFGRVHRSRIERSVG